MDFTGQPYPYRMIFLQYTDYVIPILHNTIYGNDTATRAAFMRCFYTLYALYTLHKLYRYCLDAVILLIYWNGICTYTII